MGEHKHHTNGAAAHAEMETGGLDCNRVVFCEKALVDRQNLSMITFVNVIDAMTIPDEAFNTIVPYQGHFDVAGEGNFEIQVVWFSEENSKTTLPAGNTTDTLKGLHGRQHFAALQVILPKLPGIWSLMLEWRPVGETEWRRGRGFSTVTIVSAGPAAALQAKLEAAAKSTAAKA
jgi:hypothetical protein